MTRLSALRITLLASALTVLTSAPLRAQQAKETPLSMVNALHTAFGDHHDRAVHTKGLIFEGTFVPSKEARTLVRNPIFLSGERPIMARFSLFAGVPDLPDTDDGASPAGFAIKVIAADGDDFDLETNQHRDFITATFDEFAVFLRALGAANRGDKAPLRAFLDTHPHARDFLASRTYPASYAQAKYWGVNAVTFTNSAGHSVHVRYQLVPRAGELYLTPDARKARGASYLQEDIARRVASAPVIFDWYAQIAAPGDAIADPSIAWPDTRKQVKLGTFTLKGRPAQAASIEKSLLFLPGQPHDGVAPADPMLILRNTAYPISLGQRQ